MQWSDADPARLARALERSLVAAGLCSTAEIDRQQATTDAAGPLQGGRVVARAWCDDAFKARLLADGTQAVAELGISLAGAPPLGVVEQTDQTHHLIVCTLCSCYPRALLGYPPVWYKSPAYRARAVRDPRRLLRESWATDIPPATRLRVLDSTADYRWMTLPQRPRDTDGWPEPRLATLIRSSDLIGATSPSVQAAAPPQEAE